MALALGKQKLSGAPNAVENAGAPTDLLDNFAHQGIFWSLPRLDAAARQEKPPSFLLDERQFTHVPANDAVCAWPIHVIRIGEANAELGSRVSHTPFAPANGAPVNHPMTDFDLRIYPADGDKKRDT